MDWHKSKTILIIVLIITNIVLLTIYLNYADGEDPTIGEEFIRKTEAALNDADITINTEIPRYTPILDCPFLIVKSYEQNGVNLDYFGGKADYISQRENRFILEKGSETVEIDLMRKLSYTNSSMDEKYTIDKLEDAIKIAEEFMEKKNATEETAVLDYHSVESGKYTLQYANKYENTYVENSYMKFIITRAGVVRFEKQWFYFDEKREGIPDYISINTAPKALNSLVKYPQLAGKSIESIELCYYLNAEDFNSERMSPRHGIRGKSIPAWRVFFNDGTKIILDDN